ncbi:caspase domain-containing protein [Suillus variegatus]|nr:caspase domain-containing protein [Suillus variegatus]
MANSTNVGNKKALLIAVRSVNKKSFLKPLQHAHEDAESLKCLLIDKFDYPEANVVLMKHDAEHPEHLWPSRSNILKQITKMVANATPNDQFFFYYSGHGNQVTCKHHTETDGKDEVDNKLRKVLVDPLPRGSKLFALFDSCHSETILDLEHYKCNKLLSGDSCENSTKVINGTLLVGFRVKTKNTSGQQPTTSIAWSWLPRMFIENSPSALRRVLSPVSWFKCTGDCQKMTVEEQKAAHVVSLSACRDNEYAYDDDETRGTVTKFFIECVSQDPKPSLFTLLTHIKDRVDKLNEKRQLQLRIADRRATDVDDRMREKTMPILRRHTEVVIHDLEEYMTCQKARCTSKVRAKWQNPGYASHYPLVGSSLKYLTSYLLTNHWYAGYGSGC